MVPLEASYDGQWRNDKQHGEGVELWPDGARFEGQHREGQKSGKGKLSWPDGSLATNIACEVPL